MRTVPSLKFFLFATFAFLAPLSSVHAQQWNVEAQAGRIRSSLDPAATSAQTLALGLRFTDFDTDLGLSVGVPTSNTEAIWGALGGSRRLLALRGNFVAGVDLAGSAFALHDRANSSREDTDILGRRRVIDVPGFSGSAFGGQALPLVGYEGERFQVHARTGLSYFTSRFGDVNRQRSVIVSDLQATLLPSASVALMPAVRRYQSGDDVHTYAGLSAVAGTSGASVWGSAGQWIGMDSVGTALAGGATWQAHPRAALSFSARRDVFDALYLHPAQTSWGLSVSVRVGGVSALSPPVPATYNSGHATIRLDAAHAKSAPRIAGDFNNWKPQPMQRAGDAWTYTVQLSPGVYNYAFVESEGEWFVPKNHPGRKDDGMGGVVAVMVVR